MTPVCQYWVISWLEVTGLELTGHCWRLDRKGRIYEHSAVVDLLLSFWQWISAINSASCNRFRKMPQDSAPLPKVDGCNLTIQFIRTHLVVTDTPHCVMLLFPNSVVCCDIIVCIVNCLVSSNGASWKREDSVGPSPGCLVFYYRKRRRASSHHPWVCGNDRESHIMTPRLWWADLPLHAAFFFWQTSMFKNQHLEHQRSNFAHGGGYNISGLPPIGSCYCIPRCLVSALWQRKFWQNVNF